MEPLASGNELRVSDSEVPAVGSEDRPSGETFVEERTEVLGAAENVSDRDSKIPVDEVKGNMAEDLAPCVQSASETVAETKEQTSGAIESKVSGEKSALAANEENVTPEFREEAVVSKGSEEQSVQKVSEEQAIPEASEEKAPQEVNEGIAAEESEKKVVEELSEEAAPEASEEKVVQELNEEVAPEVSEEKLAPEVAEEDEKPERMDTESVQQITLSLEEPAENVEKAKQASTPPSEKGDLL